MIFAPPYTALGPRPTIAMSSVPASIYYGLPFSVTIASLASPIAKFTLMRFCAVTHSVDMNQRCVELSFKGVENSLTFVLTAPSTASVAPPGYYMLFAVDENGSVCEQAAVVCLASAPPVNLSVVSGPTLVKTVSVDSGVVPDAELQVKLKVTDPSGKMLQNAPVWIDCGVDQGGGIGAGSIAKPAKTDATGTVTITYTECLIVPTGRLRPRMTGSGPGGGPPGGKFTVYPPTAYASSPPWSQGSLRLPPFEPKA
jgi:hypothetical protein